MRIKKLMAGLLAAAMTLTTPMSAFALGHNAAGNDNSGIITGRGGDFSANISENGNGLTSGKIGIRLSLVDANNPSNVISKDAQGNTRVVDLLYVNVDAWNHQIGGSYYSPLYTAFQYNSVKTENLKSEATDPGRIKQVFYNDVCSITPAKPMVPWLYHNGAYVSNGTAFVNWCVTDDNGNVVIKNGQLFSTRVVTALGNTVPMDIFQNTNGTLDFSNDIFQETVPYNQNISDYENLANAVSTFLEGNLSDENIKAGHERLANATDRNAVQNELAREYAGSLYAAKAALAEAERRAEEAGGAVDTAYYDSQLQRVEDSIRGKFGPVLWYNIQELANQSSNMTEEEKKAAQQQGTPIDESAGDGTQAGFEGAETAHIVQLLNAQINGEYLLYTDSMLSGEAETLADATENWVLLVEPIVWLTIFPYGTDAYPIHSKLYGTITNIVQAFNIEPGLIPYKGQRTFNYKALNYPVWWALSVDSTGFAFGWDGKDETYNPSALAFYPPNNVGSYQTFEQLYNSITQPQTINVTLEGVTKQFTNGVSGWGVNTYWKEGLFGDVPQTTDPGPGSSTTTYNDPIKVAKWYVKENYNENGQLISQTTVDVQTFDLDRKKSIAIINESAGDGIYEIEKWATGKNQSAVPSQGDTDTTFEEYAKKSPGSMSGRRPAVIDLSQKPEDKTLYIKLVFKVTVPTGDGSTTVVKVKEPVDGSTPIIEKDTAIPGATYPADENGWNYQEDIQTPDPEVPVTKWDDVPENGTPGTNPNIPVQDNTKTIYIRYTQDPAAEEPTPAGTMVLHQNELSYGYDLRDLTQNGVLAGLKDYFKSPKPLTTSAYCSGHWCSNHDTDHYRSATKRINDRRYSLSVSSSNTAPNFILDWAEKDGSWYLSKSNGKTSSFYTSQLFPNADFILYRDRNQDLVTLYPGKNASTKGELSRMGITAESYTPATHRIGSTGSGKFYATYQTNFAHDSDYDNELSWTWRDSRGCTASGTWNSTEVEGKRVSDLNATYSNTNNTEFRYELGQANTASAAPSETIDQTFTNVFANNTDVTVAQDGKLDFYPYIKMKLNDKSNNASDVYVTSTNLSSMPAYIKIEAGLWKGNSVDSDSANGNNPTPNVNLTSTQWSTHASSLEFISDNDIDDKNVVLPGGAIFDVDMKRTSAPWTGEPGDTPTTSTKLGYRIWQTCVPDELASALAPGSTAPTVSEAKNQVTAFDESVKNSVANYGLVQAVAKGITPYNGYLKNFVGDSAYQYAYNGASWMNITLSEDTKYYLKLVAPNSGDGKLDTSVSNFGIHKGGLVTQIEYKVAADVDGNVTVYRNNTPIKTINKTQGVEVLLADAEIKRVDDATKAVTNFVAALDRNLGYDRQNATWYNEAFDGITVLYSYLSYDIGLGDGSTGVISGEAKSVPVRTAVQDTFLSGVLENRADLYNFKSDSENKVRSSMILTGEYTDGGVSYPSGNLGALTTKNGTTMQITLPNMMLFAYSKMWYIPNANVTDLN